MIERDKKSKIIRVRIVVNSMTVDEDGQQFTRKAFNKITVDRFLREGIIDWHHESMNGSTIEEKASALLGKPVSFAWEDRLPVVYADLTKAQPIVRDYILPHLEAGNNVFGASVGVDAIRIKRGVWYKEPDKIVEIIWLHLAIVSREHAVSSGTSVTLVKARDDIEDITKDRRRIVASIIRAVTRAEIQPSTIGVFKFLCDMGIDRAEAEVAFHEYCRIIQGLGQSRRYNY